MASLKFNMKITFLISLFVVLITQGGLAQDFQVDPLWTSTTLRSDHTRFTRPGDVITLSGEVAPQLVTAPVSLEVTVEHPDGTYAYNGMLWTDDMGHYQLQFTVNEPGHIRVEVRYLGDIIWDYSASGSEMVIPIFPEVGTAIVVAGGGLENILFPIIEYLSDMTVQTFRRRNVPDEATGNAQNNLNRIWYLHPDPNRDFDGVDGPDVDGFPTLTNLEWAIESWAASLFQTKDHSGNWWPDGVLQTPLTIYLIGDTLIRNDGPDELYINESETLTGAMLDGYLDALELAVKQQFIDAGMTPPSYIPVNIIVEAPSSGSFIAPLSQQGRVILTSTTEGGNSYFASGGGASFSAYFLSRIAGGHYIHPSFAYAQLTIITNPALEGQRPQLEASGNGISNEIADEIATASMPLEIGSFEDARPRIQNCLGQITLRDIPAALLWAYVDDPENNLDTVEAVILPPSGSFEEAHILTMTMNETVPNRWEGIYDRFFGEGIYTIVYTAKDEAGNIAVPMVKHIIVGDSTRPLDVIFLRVQESFADTVVIAWYTSIGDTQGYRVYVTPPDSSEYLWGDVGNVHQVSVTGLDIIGQSGTYTFRVTAYDRVPLESYGVSVTTVLEYQNQAPVANAGPDQVITHIGTTIQLDGSQSYDPENDPITYSWAFFTKPNGSSATLLDYTSPAPTFIPDVYGEYVIELVVSDADVSSDPDLVTVSFDNLSPVADAGTDQSVHVGTMVILDGSGSSDPNGDSLSYHWEITSKPENSLATLSGQDSVNPAFTSDLLGDYVIELVVSDGEGLSSVPGQVFVQTYNNSPIADAGPDQALIEIGSIVELDGSQSYDDDGDAVSFSWIIVTKPEDSVAYLNNSNSANPTFEADVHGEYVIELVVSDQWAQSSPDTVAVSFLNVRPVADAGNNQSVIAGETVYLNGNGSYDANKDPLIYNWAILSKPLDSLAEITDPMLAETTFMPDLPGEYLLSLIVYDDHEYSDPSCVTVMAISQQNAVILALQDGIDAINSLGDVVLKNKNMKKTLTHKINAALGMVDEENYQEALDKLKHDILGKTNGCAEAGVPDRNDWIEDCEAQGQVYPFVLEAIGLLGRLI